MTDQEILTVLQNNNLKGGTEALKYLYKKNYHMIEVYILKNSGLKEDAKDIFQDSVIILYKNIKKETFELNGKMSSYLYSISRNLWLKKLRNNKINTFTIDDYGDSFIHDSDILNDIVYSEDQKMIGEMLTKAGEQCKKILIAFYYEKLSFKQIVLKQGYSSVQIAKNQKLRCLKKIRTILNKSGHYFNLENSY